jgi:hypothetical protein
MARKTFKDFFFEKYEPKDEFTKRLVKKHVIAKTQDANGNKDDVFNATNVKMFDRHLEHGYNPGEDEEVYEDLEPLDELSRKTLASYAYKSSMDMADAEGNRRMHIMGVDGEQRSQKSFEKKLKHSIKRQVGIGMATRKLAKEDTDLQELSRKTLGQYVRTASNTMRGAESERAHATTDLGIAHRRPYDKYRNADIRDANTRLYKSTKSIQNRWNGIVRATARLEKEEVELDELHQSTLARYVRKAGDDIQDKKWGMSNGPSERSDSARRITKRVRGTSLAAQKLAGNRMTVQPQREEVENLGELSRPTLGRYLRKAATSLTNHAYDAGDLENQLGKHKGPMGMQNGKSGWKVLTPKQALSNRLGKSVTRTLNRERGIQRAAGKLTGSPGPYRSIPTKVMAKEETQIDELSRDTLVKYIHHATTDAATQGMRSQDPVTTKDAVRRGRSRIKGATKAAVRLAYTNGHPQKKMMVLRPEEVQIDELSHDTIKSYQKKSKSNQDYHQDMSDEHTTKKYAADDRGNLAAHALHAAYARAHERKTARRQKGLDLAKKRLGEENLDELSTDLKKRYEKEALKNLTWHSNAWDRLAKEPYFDKKQQQHFDFHDKEAEKRYKGFKMVKKSLRKEDTEELDELSKGTLHKYIDKALTDVHNAGYKSGVSFTKDRDMKDVVPATLHSMKRQFGIKKAAKKLAKEDKE